MHLTKAKRTHQHPTTAPNLRPAKPNIRSQLSSLIRVFHLSEICEIILERLEVENLLSIRKAWGIHRRIIANSRKLRRALFIEPHRTLDGARINPLVDKIASGFGWGTTWEYCDGSENGDPPAAEPWLVLTLEEKDIDGWDLKWWDIADVRRMLVVQLPMTIEVHGKREEDEYKVYLCTLEKSCTRVESVIDRISCAWAKWDWG